MTSEDKKENLTLYIYYKIPADKHLQYVLSVEKLITDIKKCYAYLEIKLQIKMTLDAENKETWMEIYQGISQENIQKLMDTLNLLAKQHGLPTERRQEVFIPL